MRISQQGLGLIRRFEGFSAMPYLCPAGYETVGYGHVVTRADRGSYPLSEMNAQLLLAADVEVSERAVEAFIKMVLTQPQFDALVSFTYNLGAAALQRSTLRRVVNRGDHAAAAAQFMRWVYGGGRILKGLVVRRTAEAALYNSSNCNSV